MIISEKMKDLNNRFGEGILIHSLLSEKEYTMNVFKCVGLHPSAFKRYAMRNTFINPFKYVGMDP